MISTMQMHRPVGGHPIRQSIRFAVLKQQTRKRKGQEARPARFSMQDLREFLIAYCACFLAVSTFIA